MADLEKPTTAKLSERYRVSFLVAGACHVLVFGIASITFDFGVSLRISAMALIPFWITAAVVFARRPTLPTRGDRWFIAWGYPVIVVVMILINVGMNL